MYCNLFLHKHVYWIGPEASFCSLTSQKSAFLLTGIFSCQRCDQNKLLVRRKLLVVASTGLVLSQRTGPVEMFINKFSFAAHTPRPVPLFLYPLNRGGFNLLASLLFCLRHFWCRSVVSPLDDTRWQLSGISAALKKGTEWLGVAERDGKHEAAHWAVTSAKDSVIFFFFVASVGRTN